MLEGARRNQGLRQGKSSLLDYKKCFLILLSGIHRTNLDRFIRGDPLKRKSRAEELGIIPMRTPEDIAVKSQLGTIAIVLSLHIALALSSL